MDRLEQRRAGADGGTWRHPLRRAHPRARAHELARRDVHAAQRLVHRFEREAQVHGGRARGQQLGAGRGERSVARVVQGLEPDAVGRGDADQRCAAHLHGGCVRGIGEGGEPLRDEGVRQLRLVDDLDRAAVVARPDVRMGRPSTRTLDSVPLELAERADARAALAQLPAAAEIGQVDDERQPTTLPPVCSIRSSAAMAVPPVAIRSSTSRICSPGAMASVWISTRSVPYSSA